MERLFIAALIVVVVAVVAVAIRRTRATDPPTQRRYTVPDQLDRDDFDRPDAAWLVAVFTSTTCDLCRNVVDKAMVLASDDVAVEEVEFTASRGAHERYAIDAVPAVVICDADGVTRASFLGPMTATDLWAAVAEVREPGSSPEPHLGHEHE